MLLPKRPVAAFAALASLALLGGCERPTHDPATLKAVASEARTLMTANPAHAEISKARWPRTIASLEPELVTIDPDGVHITMAPSFDGGWGYFVPRRERRLPEPVERFEEAGQGVYWWRPY